MTGASRTTVAVSVLFLSLLAFNGSGHNLHWLSLWALLFLCGTSASLVRQNLTRFSLEPTWLPAAVTIYLGWLVIAPFVSTYPYASSTTAWTLAVLPLTFLGWLIVPNENREAAWRVTWRALLATGTGLAVWGVFDLAVLGTRSHGPLIDANAYAALINLFLIPVAFTYLTAPTATAGSGLGKHRALLALLALLATAQFMSQSRGAVLALLAILPLLLWFGRSAPEFRRRLPWVLLVLATAYAVVKFGPFEQRQSVETLLFAPGEQMEKDPALSARLLMWRSTWRIIQDSNPIVGTGLGTYKTYYVAYREEMETSGNLAHNDYLQGLQEGGVIQLGFFLLLTVFAPVWLLRSAHKDTRKDIYGEGRNAAGLALGLMCVSLHAVINFIHYVAPIAMLTGIYLARAWETVRPQQTLHLLPAGGTYVKPGFVKALAITLLAVPTAGLALDGAIFKIFSGADPIFHRLDSATRSSVRNIALTFRPGNPYPRASLVQDLLSAVQQEQRPGVRDELLRRAEQEAEFLATSAPGLASGRFLMGRIRAMKGTTEDLRQARDDLEYAVKRVPPATGMRLELVRVYQKLGQDDKAYQIVRDARKWITLEVDAASLIAFAKEAQAVAIAQHDRDEAGFWRWVSSNIDTSSGAGG